MPNLAPFGQRGNAHRRRRFKSVGLAQPEIRELNHGSRWIPAAFQKQVEKYRTSASNVEPLLIRQRATRRREMVANSTLRLWFGRNRVDGASNVESRIWIRNFVRACIAVQPGFCTESEHKQSWPKAFSDAAGESHGHRCAVPKHHVRRRESAAQPRPSQRGAKAKSGWSADTIDGYHTRL
jgi:hypothetical protein